MPAVHEDVLCWMTRNIIIKRFTLRGKGYEKCAFQKDSKAAVRYKNDATPNPLASSFILAPVPLLSHMWNLLEKVVWQNSSHPRIPVGW
jgi:hypothetical protein